MPPPPAHVADPTSPSFSARPSPVAGPAHPIPFRPSGQSVITACTEILKRKHENCKKKSLKNIYCHKSLFNVDFKYLFIFQWIRNSRSSCSKRYLSWFLFSWFLSLPRPPLPSLFIANIPRTVPSAVTYWPIQRVQFARFPSPVPCALVKPFICHQYQRRKGFFLFLLIVHKKISWACVNNCPGKQTNMWHMQHAIWQH